MDLMMRAAVGVVLLLAFGSMNVQADAEVPEGESVLIPVLRTALENHATAWFDYHSVTDAHDPFGPWIADVQGTPFYAFLALENGQGQMIAHQGLDSLAGIDPLSVTYSYGDLELRGVEGNSAEAYETFFEGDQQVQPFSMWSPSGPVVGAFGELTAVVSREPATAGQATGFGYVNLVATPGSPLSDELNARSCNGQLWFDLTEFTATVFGNPSTFFSTGRAYPVNILIGAINGPTHGDIVVDYAAGTITYTPDIGFAGFDAFSYEVTDCAGVTIGEETVELVVGNPPAGAAPEASFTGPATTDRTQINAFQSTSTDDVGVVAWAWDFGDGATATGEIVTHQFSTLGANNVCLTVTDGGGLTDTACHITTVVNLPPTISFTYSPDDPTDLDVVTFTAIVNDPDGDDLGPISWDLDDANVITDNSAKARLPAGLAPAGASIQDVHGASGSTNTLIPVVGITQTATATGLHALGVDYATSGQQNSIWSEGDDSAAWSEHDIAGVVLATGAGSESTNTIGGPEARAFIAEVSSLEILLLRGAELLVTADGCGTLWSSASSTTVAGRVPYAPFTYLDEGGYSLILHEQIFHPSGHGLTVQNRLSTPSGDVILGQASVLVEGCPDRPLAT